MTERLNKTDTLETMLAKTERNRLAAVAEFRRGRPASIPAGRPAVAAAVPWLLARAPSPATSSATLNSTISRERDRIRGILQAPEADGREKEARALAFQSATDVAKARAILASLRVDTEADEIDAVARRIAGRVSGRPADKVANACTEVDELDVVARRIAGRVADRTGKGSTA